jgi:uncharacterized RDD family membrane protein YckC
MTYPQWWERLVAGIIDGVIFAVVSYILQEIFISIGIGMGSISMLQVMAIISVIITVVLVVLYKTFFEGGSWQATPGKMVFGLKVVDESGGKPDRKAVIMRTWPWWVQLITVIQILLLMGQGLFGIIILVVMIAVFVSFFLDPKGRCLHDQTAGLNVIKADKGMVGGA